METKQYTFADKSSWPDGPWKNEPDKIQWEDPATKLPCLIKRNDSGALCGYVGVPPNHPYWHDSYDMDLGLGAHGGLTFADFCSGDEEHGICHVPAEGEPKNVWWFGFDCAHSGDYMPSDKYGLNYGDSTYRDLAYVQQECTQLAAQLAIVK